MKSQHFYALIAPALLFVLWGQTLAAQEPSRFQLGFSPMATVYSGDLDREGEAFNRVGGGGNISVQLDAPKVFSPQANLGYARFTAQNRDLAVVDGAPNTFVQTRYFYLDAILRFRLFRYNTFRPHFGPGFGLLAFWPHDTEGDGLVNQPETRARQETYNNVAATIPLAVGFTVTVNQFVSLGMDYHFRLTTTDYLDNIGELGTVSGNDQLHNLLLTLYWKPGMKKRTGRSGR